MKKKAAKLYHWMTLVYVNGAYRLVAQGFTKLKNPKPSGRKD